MRGFRAGLHKDSGVVVMVRKVVLMAVHGPQQIDLKPV